MNRREELRRYCLGLAVILSKNGDQVEDVVGTAGEMDFFIRTGRTLFDGREFTPPSQNDDLEN